MIPANEIKPNGSNKIKVNEDDFLEEFLPNIVGRDVVVEVVDKKGNIKGYITDKELKNSL